MIANILNKDEILEWIERELFGYYNEDEIPNYRILSCKKKSGGFYAKGFHSLELRKPVSFLLHCLKTNEGVEFDKDDESYYVTSGLFDTMLSGIIDKCLFFLNEIITELQYGGTVENLMEAIRKNTDEKLAKLDKKIVDEAQSLFLNLTSTNPADWNKVGHSSRKMLKLLADNVFPPQNQLYNMKDKRELEVGDDKFINRLCAFLDQKISGSERKLIIAEVKYFESYLHQVTKYAQRGEHKPSIEKYQADMLAIHTYLIISEILRYND